MKKFKKSIEISTDNILEVLDCPIVECIRKCKDGFCVEGRGELYITRSVLVVDVAGISLQLKLYTKSALDVMAAWGVSLMSVTAMSFVSFLTKATLTMQCT